MKELTLAATVENIGVVTDFVGERLEKMNCPMKIQTQINIAIDEIFGNIAHYAYSPDVGYATIRVEATDESRSIMITFIDGGVPYNPLTAAVPDITLSAEERSLGGLGIFMVKKSMDEMTYRHENGKNILSIRKILRS